MAYNTKNINGGEFDNKENVREIVKLRLEIAKLLGYNDYAYSELKHRMAKNADNVYKLLNDLCEAFMLVAQEEVKDIQDLLLI